MPSTSQNDHTKSSKQIHNAPQSKPTQFQNRPKYNSTSQVPDSLQLGYLPEVPIPDFVLKHDSNHKEDQYSMDYYESTIRHRLKKGVGLREWEWTCGEPSNESTQGDNSEIVTSHCPETYEARVKQFTYTRGEDPIFRGRRMKLGRGRTIIQSKPEFSEEVSQEDQRYVPEQTETFITVVSRGYLQCPVQEESQRTVDEDGLDGLEYEYIEPEYAG